mmetsp:Transcript_86393/g.244911  ORF Transcript_86393/g.244911 Transcript_86393/m.244911 type:complete len:218 (-) Transcript_86393:33-686(-)
MLLEHALKLVEERRDSPVGVVAHLLGLPVRLLQARMLAAQVLVGVSHQRELLPVVRDRVLRAHQLELQRAESSIEVWDFRLGHVRQLLDFFNFMFDSFYVAPCHVKLSLHGDPVLVLLSNFNLQPVEFGAQLAVQAALGQDLAVRRGDLALDLLDNSVVHLNVAPQARDLGSEFLQLVLERAHQRGHMPRKLPGELWHYIVDVTVFRLSTMIHSRLH